MTDEKKTLDQAMEAAVAELKAKGAAPAQEPVVEAQSEPEETPVEETTPPDKAEPDAEKAEPAEPEKTDGKKPEKKKEKKPEGKKPTGKKGAAALKELAKVRRNKIIGITAAVIAVMVGIFLIARNAPGAPAHGGKPTVMEDGTKQYPDGTQELADGTVVDPDGTVTEPDGTVVQPDGTVVQPDGTVIPPAPIEPGDTNTSNVIVDDGSGSVGADTPWSKMTDSDYQISMRRLNAYNGPFLEDGSDAEVSNVLALQFRNDGDQDVQYAEYVFLVNGTEVPFKVTNLPAGQSCVVLAANKQAYNAADVLKLKSRLVAHVDYLPTADDQLLLVNNGDDTVTIMNLTNQPIPVARVFYKTYYAEQNTFVGGITYTIEVKNIPANGSSGAVAPAHFSSELSRFVGSGVYDS